MSKKGHHIHRVYILEPFGKDQGLGAVLLTGLFEKKILGVLTGVAEHQERIIFFSIS